MVPQEGGGLDWWHAISGAGGGILGTFLTWLWRAARAEPQLRSDVKTDIDAAEKRMEAKVEGLISGFRDSFNAFRQKLNDVELDTEKRFLQKGEFEDFRKEYRDDMRDIKALIQRNGHK